MSSDSHPVSAYRRVNTIDLKIPIQDRFEMQRQAFLKEPNPDYRQRILRLKRLQKVLLNNKTALLSALNKDFGGRSETESLLAEIVPSLGNLHYTIKKLKKWMKPSKRQLSLQLLPASAKVIYQPLGVVGIVVPFNYPVFLSFGPLITILAAGNRAMIKMSEFTPNTSELMALIFEDSFANDLISVVCGDAEVAAKFTQLPFDHLFFTGSTKVGAHVMRAAADNLTPVTLELGGKSPVIVDDDFPIDESAERICFAKSINAGQTCVAPDYLLVKKSVKMALIGQLQKAFIRMYPKINNNDDYTSIINNQHYTRILALLEDARNKGAVIHTLGDETIDDVSRRMPIYLIENPDDTMHLMQEEIFGPLLPIVSIDSLEEAIHFVQNRPRPLALYYFGSSAKNQKMILEHTHSGGVCFNECMLHVVVEDLPFGGVGASGMGHYHGYEGFLTFSKAKAVLSKGIVSSTKLVYPPYGGWLQKKLLAFFSRG